MLPRVCIHDLHILVAVEHGLEAIYVQGAVSAELWRRSRQIQVQRAIFSLRLVLILQCCQTLSSIDPRFVAHILASRIDCLDVNISNFLASCFRNLLMSAL